MDRSRNQKMAMETLKIIDDGHYYINGKTIRLAHQNYHDVVKVFSPEEVNRIVDDADDFFCSAFCGYESCEFCVVNMDSYEAAHRFGISGKTLVMNFANAHHPGGGFINGASAQEESLCRCSTLYTSINSKDAKEMYDYNDSHRNAYDSDYILISPYVDVFRSSEGDLLSEYYSTAVLTIPAPNLFGLAKDVDKDELAEVMRDKIRKFLQVAASELYNTLVLGAWGCGAFGHDAADVAGYFKQILEEEQFNSFFKKVIFAVYDSSKEQYNYNSFLDCFGSHGIWGKQIIIQPGQSKTNAIS